MEQLQTDKINELRRELTLTRASFGIVLIFSSSEFCFKHIFIVYYY